MGNCSFKGTTGECHHHYSTIRVLSDSGAILQFKAPKTVGQVLQHYPGYGVFHRSCASIPLPEQESLSHGLLYYLLPLKESSVEGDRGRKSARVALACDYVENLSSALEVLPSAKNGVWRVKLVIDTSQLEQILSEQVNIEALIDKMRMVATSTSNPIRSRTMNTLKLGWKSTLFFNTISAPPSSGKFSKSNIAIVAAAGGVGSNSNLE